MSSPQPEPESPQREPQREPQPEPKSPEPGKASPGATAPDAAAAEARAAQLENRLTLRVCDENNNEYAFMMKHSTPFKRIFDAFTRKVGVRLGTFRFHFDGLRLAEEDTPGRVGLKDDDLIEAFVLAEGG